MGNVSTWATTAAGNDTGSPPDFFPENMAASSVNNACREMQAAIARVYQDQNASLTSGGSSNAYTLTTNNGFTNLGDLCPLVFIANHSNTAGTATLKVDALIAKNLRVGGSTTLVADQIIADVAYMVIYNATDDVFDVIGAFTNDASKLTQGTLADARLSSNVPRLDQDNTVTVTVDGALTWALLNQSTGTGAYARYRLQNSAGKVAEIYYTGVNFASSIFTGGPTGEQMALGTSAAIPISFGTNATERMRIAASGTVTIGSIASFSASEIDLTSTTIDVNGTVAVDGVTFSGAFTASNATAGEPGYLGVPRVSVTTDTTIAAAHSGKELVLSSAADDITVQASGAPVQGMVVFLDNQTGGAVDILQGAGMTLTLDGTSTTGNRTLAANGRAYIRFTSSSTASVGGPGVS